MSVHRSWFKPAVLASVAAILVAGLVVRTSRDPHPTVAERGQAPVRFEIAMDVPPPTAAFDTRVVHADLRVSRGYYDVTPQFRSAVAGFESADKPTQARTTPKGVGYPIADFAVNAPPTLPIAESGEQAAAPTGSGQVASFESTNFVDNIATTGNVFIPADSQGAAGPNHVASVTNTTASFHTKTGVEVAQFGIAGFFASLDPETFTFDPRVIYDSHNERWILLSTEFTDVGVGFPADTSRIFLAVSDDDNPTGFWNLTVIDAVSVFFTTGAGTVAHWVDFPQVAVDEEAIYITGSMFTFSSNQGRFGGIRLWIIDKGEGVGGFYDGGTATVDQYDPLPSPAIVTGTTPAMMFGTPASATFGTYLVSYSGISDGTNEAVQIVRVDDPLGTPTFTPSLVLVGNIHNTGIALPNAPQSGIATRIETNDSRALKAVWRADNLWATFSITPNAGDPEVGQTVAHWLRMDVADTPVLGEQGRVSGEDIALGTHTFFPSLAVNADLDVMIGFSASAPSIFPGAYYALHDANAAPGTVGLSAPLREGVDFYKRMFTDTRNRWGDFGSVSVDPVDDCFWIYNGYAMLRGTPTEIEGVTEDGRWGTRFAKFCNSVCAGQPDRVTDVVGSNEAGTVFGWADLGPGFTYDVAIGTVSVMRADGMVGPAGCLVQGLADPIVVDSLPSPPQGQARYYLVRGRSTCELGDYGTDSAGALRLPVPGCPD